MKTFTRIAIAATLLGWAGQVAAHETAQSSLDSLRTARQRLELSQRSGPKGSGGATDLLRQEQQRLDGLIGDLEAGRRVDPSAIDRALERAGRGW